VTTPSRKERFQVGRAETDRRLRIQLGILAAVFVVVTALAVERVIRGGLDPFWPLAGFAAGLVIGSVLGRSKTLDWDAADQEVVKSMSVFGIIVTILYLAFMVLARERLLTDIVGSVVTAGVTALAMTGGVMLGRTLVTFRTIRRVLTNAGRFDDAQQPNE
jgi:hypothetical protein